MSGSLTGVLTAIATPLTPDGGAVDVAALRRHVDWGIESGTDGFVPGGSTGEFAFLSSDERRLVTETVISQVDGRVPVLPQVGAMTTAETISLARHAKEAGAVGVMVVAPYYEPLTVAETVDFYRSLADTVDIAIMVYNLPVATGVRLGLDEMTTLVDEIDNVKHVKDTSGDFALGAQLIHNLGDRVDVFVGWDPMYFAALMEGAAGSVIGSANVVPAELATIYDDIAAGRYADARASWQRVYPVLEQIVAKPYNASIKAGMELVGRGGGPLRAPQAGLDVDDRAALGKRLAALG